MSKGRGEETNPSLRGSAVGDVSDQSGAGRRERWAPRSCGSGLLSVFVAAPSVKGDPCYAARRARGNPGSITSKPSGWECRQILVASQSPRDADKRIRLCLPGRIQALRDDLLVCGGGRVLRLSLFAAYPRSASGRDGRASDFRALCSNAYSTTLRVPRTLDHVTASPSSSQQHPSCPSVALAYPFFDKTVQFQLTQHGQGMRQGQNSNQIG